MAQIKIMVSRHSAFYSPLIATIAAGFLKEEGLDPSYSVMTEQKTTGEAVGDGDIDVGQSAVSDSWRTIDSGKKLQVVNFAQINARDGFFIAGREPDAEFTWKKLIGQDVMVDHGSQPLAMFKFASHKQDADHHSINIIDAGDNHTRDQAFRDGQGDYIHQQGPYPQQLEKDNIGHIVASVGKAIGPVAFSSLIATPRWLSTDKATAFTRAYVKASIFVNTVSAAEIADAEVSFFPGIDLDVLTNTIEFYQKLGCWNPDPTIKNEHYERALDVFQYSGLISKRHPYKELVVTPPTA